MKDIEKCCYCGHPVTVEGFYDAERGEEWEKVTPIETENEELKQRVKKLEARIEELISSKGIKELEARLANAEAHGQDFKDECGRLTATLKLSQLRADDKEVEQSVNDALQTTKIAKLEARLADAEVVSKIPTHNHTHKISG